MSIEKNFQIALRASLEASIKVMEYYTQGFKVEKKPDNSYVTEADIAAHKILVERLSQSTSPILSEEGEHFTPEVRSSWDTFWCLDPIDGTYEFVHKTDEFCICVGLVDHNTSYIGIMIAPALDLMYFAAEGYGSYKLNIPLEKAYAWIHEGHIFEILQSHSVSLPILDLPKKYTVLSSKTFRNADDEAYRDELISKHPDLQYITMGSAIKIGLLAEGKAHEYTRKSPVNFWDIAAGHAIAKYAGIDVLDVQSHQEIHYQDENMKVHNYSLIQKPILK